jgi:hypothetical protein
MPFIFSGFTPEALSNLGDALPLFLFGLIPLLVGSTFWMYPVFWLSLSPFSIIYHLWTALGAGLSLLIFVDLLFTGDPPPPRNVFFAPAWSAFLIGFVTSWLLARYHSTRNA